MSSAVRLIERPRQRHLSVLPRGVAAFAGGNVPKVTCSIETCERLATARGWCNPHYQRFLRHGDPLVQMVVHYATRAEYLAANSDRSGGPHACWPWTGTIEKDGYGQTKWHRKCERANRVAYEELVGPVPAGKVLDHACHVPETCKLGSACPHRRCVNPRHLIPRTSEQNVSVGRCYEAEQTHCLNGHSLGLDGDVRYLPKYNRRVCRVCDRARKREYYHRKALA